MDNISDFVALQRLKTAFRKFTKANDLKLSIKEFDHLSEVIFNDMDKILATGHQRIESIKEASDTEEVDLKDGLIIEIAWYIIVAKYFCYLLEKRGER